MKRWLEVLWVCARVIWSRNVSRRGRHGVPPLGMLDIVSMLVHSVTGVNRLWLSRQYMDIAGAQTGLRFAQRHVPASEALGIRLLKANAARDDDAWLAEINAYLGSFGASPVALSRQEGSRFERLVAPSQDWVEDGPLVTVIMAAYNAQSVIRSSINSILGQSWRNLELIIVDDCSTDGTWAEVQAAAACDDRVRLLRNEVNVGPYVSKNLALRAARGIYVTGHDADDWAHPQRLQRDIETLAESAGAAKAVISMMVRMSEHGQFYLSHRPKGAMRSTAAISLLIETAWLRDRLGAWDSVRFGADNELIARAERLLGPGLLRPDRIGMLCLELASSLSSHPVYGVSAFRRVSPVRQQYKDGYLRWHASLGTGETTLPFPPVSRRFEAPEIMQVPLDAIQRNIDAHDRQTGEAIAA